MNDVHDRLGAWLSGVNINVRNDDGVMHPMLVHENTAILNEAKGAKDTPAMVQVTGDEPVPDQQRILYEAQKKYGATSDEAVQAMLRAPATGLMHVSDMARAATGWNPVLLDSNANSVAYDAYLQKMLNFPLVTLNYANHEMMRRTTSDWNTLIDAIADTFQGIAAEDKGAIVSGLKNLAQAASSKESTEQKTALFCQNAINTANDTYQFFLYNSTATFKEEKGKGFDMKSNDFNVLKIKVTLKYELWTEQAVKMLIGQTAQSLDDWITGNSTSLEGTSPIPALQQGTP